jgi:hypothetical protein
MRFGTAPEDAMRRDFTINALFFNLVTKQVPSAVVIPIETALTVMVIN